MGPVTASLDVLHRWTGGLLGLLLMVMGASGTLLLHADSLFRPPSPSSDPAAPLAGIVAKAIGASSAKPDYIVFASSDYPFHRIVYADGSGRYLNAAGDSVAFWQSLWERPELWLFDLHRYLFLGPIGETIVGIVGLLGAGFVFSGSVLWWQRRRSFAPRLLPARLTRPAIMRHHRDLGIILAPLLLLMFMTGAMMAIKPIGFALVRPWSSSQAIEATWAAPALDDVGAGQTPDWEQILDDAHRRFPAAHIRLLGFPRRKDRPALVRVRQPRDWLPNGQTSLWYAPHDGGLLRAQDVHALPLGGKILGDVYPLHAGKVGGALYLAALTGVGLGLVMVGSLSVWSFWFKRPRRGKIQGRKPT